MHALTVILIVQMVAGVMNVAHCLMLFAVAIISIVVPAVTPVKFLQVFV